MRHPFLHEVAGDLGCEEHIGIAGIVIVHMDGQVFTHRHASLPDFTGQLAAVVDGLRAELLAEAAAGGIVP